MSIAEHTAAPIHVHVFDDGVAPRRKNKLLRLASRYRHLDLTFHTFKEMRFDACLTDWYPTRAIFARYFIAELFPEYALALYLDVDMIVEADVADLFEIGTGGRAVAACPDMGLGRVVDVDQHKIRLGIPPEHRYFNNGLLLIDCDRWRREGIAEELARCAIERRGDVVFPSQDPMNIYFAPNAQRELPQYFNFMPPHGDLPEPPVVMHFCWPRPWFQPRTMGGERYWGYARRSPFLGELRWRLQQWRLEQVRNRARKWSFDFASRAVAMVNAFSLQRRHLVRVRRVVRKVRRLWPDSASGIGRWTGGTVVAGPFRGMSYLPLALGSALPPKLLGTYERELHPWIEEIALRLYATIHVIGCAEGYYAVGLALRSPASTVHAYDLHPQAPGLLRRLAARNGVSRRVTFRGLFSAAALADPQTPPALLVCDIEGDEVELLDPAQAPGLLAVDMLVEVHDAGTGSIEGLLESRFQTTHQIRRTTAVPRTLADIKTEVRPPLSPRQLQRLLEEGRSKGLTWLYLTVNDR